MANLNQGGIDISNFTAAKAKGTIALLKGVGGNYILQQLRFDPTEGTPIAPALANVNMQSLAEMREFLSAQRAETDRLLSEVDAVETAMVALG